MPKSDYNEAANAIFSEIGRLENVGQSVIEFLFVLFAIINKSNWSHLPKEIESEMLEMLENSNINMLAK
jgi:hypothetical protein